MRKYIMKPGHSLSTPKGIVGPPVDPENPTKKEIITVHNFNNGEKGLAVLLQHKKCPLIPFESKKETIEKELVDETDQISITDKDSQQSEKNEKSKGAVKK